MMNRDPERVELLAADDYEWVNDEMFNRKLMDIMTRMNADDILQIPGVYFVVSNYLNKRVLEELEEERAEERRRD